MAPELIYWIAIAAIGLLASIGSGLVGLRIHNYLRAKRPELLGGYWPESVRDLLLVLGLTCNLLVGVMAANPSPSRDLVALIAILGGATCLSLFAVFNFALRVGR